MADGLPNGANGSVNNADVEMKEEPNEVRIPADYAARLHEMLIGFQTSLSSITQAQPQTQQQDPTDPNPPPQAPQSINPAMLSQPEHLSTIAPAVATPPVASAASARPGSMPPQPSARPDKPVAHGGPTRQYLNGNVTPHLLEGMKYLAVYEPEKPLAWLAEFLKSRSEEVER